VLLTLLAAAALQQATTSPLFANGPYSQPLPAKELGYELGSRISTYRDQERYLIQLAGNCSSRMKLEEFGKSVEGRPLRIAIVSDPSNMARLEAIRLQHLDLAQGKGDPAATIPIVWINETIHGDEPASFESGMALLYNLASSSNPGITSLLKNVVVIVNPVFNPDGHERFAVYYDSVAVGNGDPRSYEMGEPGVIYGRLNHYRFDMNRDRVAFSQDETKQEIKEFLRWNPQVYADQHGQVDNYFFPPNAESINSNVGRQRLEYWTSRFGKATASAFDKLGYGYFVRDEFDFYYPGYLDSFTTLSGAIGMTQETNGGPQITREEGDGASVTLLRGIEKHFTSALAVIRTAAQDRTDLLKSYCDFKNAAVSGKSSGKFQRVVLVSSDPRPLERLAAQLASAGIASKYAARSFSQTDTHDYWSDAAGTHEFPAGSLIVDMAQSQGPLAKALLEPQSDFEPEFYKAQQDKKNTAPEGEEYPGPDGTEFYDTTAWALPFAYNLPAWWCDSAPTTPTGAMPSTTRSATVDAPVLAVPYTDEQDILGAADLLNAGVRVEVSPKPMEIDTKQLPAGTFFILAERNEPGYLDKVARVQAKRHLNVIPLSTMYPDVGRQAPGKGDMAKLRPPKIGVVFGRDGSIGSIGGIWFLMERVFQLPYTPLRTDALGRRIDDFTTIVVPAGTGVTLTQKLRDWVTAGGNLVVLDNPSWAIGSSAFIDLSTRKMEGLPGSLFRAQLDRRSYLSYGYSSDQLAVPIDGDTSYLIHKEGGNVVSLSPDEKAHKLLSGFEFEDGTEEALAGTLWLLDAPIGNGHVTLFFKDPCDRAMWPGLHKLLLNAMLINPS
jgi:hypothetical protein